MGAHALLRVVADRNAVDEDVARRNVVETRDKLAERRFAAARRSHERHGLPAFDVERNAVDHLAAAVVGEVYVAEFDLVFQAVQLQCAGLVLNFALGVDDREDALSGRDALIDVGELVDEGAHGACDLREHGDEGDEAFGAERPLEYERTAEYEDDAHGRDAEEFAHRRSQLLAARHREGQPGQIGVQVVELLLDIIHGVVALDDLDARKGLVERRYQLAHALLARAGRVAQAFDDAADDEGHHGQKQHREEGQLPRYGDHHHRIADDEERLAESHLQGVGDAELHHADVGGDFRNDVALALVAEKADVHVHHLREHLVAHALQRAGAHVLHRPRTQIAEQVAQQAHENGHYGEHEQYVFGVVFVEQMRVGVVEQGCQVFLIEGQRGKFLHIYERVVGVEHRLEDRHDQQERERVEQRVEQRVEEIGNCVLLDGSGETQEPHVYFKHYGRIICRLCDNRDKDRNNNDKIGPCGSKVRSLGEIRAEKGKEAGVAAHLSSGS